LFVKHILFKCYQPLSRSVVTLVLLSLPWQEAWVICSVFPGELVYKVECNHHLNRLVKTFFFLSEKSVLESTFPYVPIKIMFLVRHKVSSFSLFSHVKHRKLDWQTTHTVIGLSVTSSDSLGTHFQQRFKIHFSPPNSPFLPAKYALMPDKVIIMYDIIYRVLMNNLFDWIRHVFSPSIFISLLTAKSPMQTGNPAAQVRRYLILYRNDFRRSNMLMFSSPRPCSCL